MLLQVPKASDIGRMANDGFGIKHGLREVGLTYGRTSTAPGTGSHGQECVGIPILRATMILESQ